MVDEKGILNVIDISEVGVTDSLIGYWPLNGNAFDHSGNLRHGIVVGATFAGGKDQLACSFNGINNYINTDNIAFTSAQNWSVSLWIKEETTSGTVFLLGDRASAVKSVCLLAGGLYYRTSDGTYVGGYPFTRTEWNQICILYDAGTLRFYINGDLVGTPYNLTSADFNNFANAYNAAEYLFGGKMQGVRLYSKALSPEEVLINYTIEAKLSAMKKAADGKIYISGTIREV